MSLVLSGTDGLSDVDGSAATPAIRGTDANTGIFFPAADTIAFAEGGTEVMRIDSSGNVGIGASSPGTKLEVASSGANIVRSRSTSNNPQFELFADGYATAQFAIDRSSGVQLFGTGAIPIVFSTNSTERARIDSSGNLLVGTTSAGVDKVRISASHGPNVNLGLVCADDINGTYISFRNSAATQIGSITRSGASTVAYNTSSDYRLKEAVSPMTGALSRVAALKPVTYKWKADGSDGEGFIAHELQAVVPDCVTGEKDAVDAEGKPVYQGIDTSFLVATLTAAIQELKAIVDAQSARITALETA